MELPALVMGGAASATLLMAAVVYLSGFYYGE